MKTSKKIPILSITPNPTLDLSGNIREFIPNEKLYVKNELRLPGGNAINSARIIHRLHSPVLVTGFLGGSTGQEIQGLLNREGIRSDFIMIKRNSRTCISIKDSKNSDQLRFDFAGPEINTAEKNLLLKSINVKNISGILLGGSLPPNFTPKDVKKILLTAKKNDLKCIVDCPASIMKDLLHSGIFMIKPNLSEFQDIMNFKKDDLKSVIKKAKTLKHIPFVCISSVEGGALLVTGEDVYYGKSPKVKIKTTVGAGDSMVGVMAMEIFNGNTLPDDILRWGLAAAASTLKQNGTTLGTRKDILALYKKTKVQKLI